MVAVIFVFLGLLQIIPILVSGNPAAFRGFPPEYNCEHEGYFVDPEDCKNFFRCYYLPANYTIGFTIYKDYEPPVLHLAKFQCGSGTLFDETISTCNYPEKVNPNQKCVRKPEPAYEPPAAAADENNGNPPPEKYHECYTVNDNSEMVCIKDQGSDEGIVTYNYDKRRSISYAVREVRYRCGNPREVISREYIGEYTLQPEQEGGVASRGVTNRICRKTVFYDFKIEGIPSKYVNPPFYIQFAFELRPPFL